MGKDEFEGLFGGDDLAELTAAMDEAAAEHEAAQAAAEPEKIRKDGVWYNRDEQNADGHTVSIYEVNLGGKTLAWVRIDNDLELPAEELAKLGKVPDGVTGHAIVIHNAQLTYSFDTNGIALRYPHQDGTHIDGQTVRAYVLPRLTRFLGQMYGV